VDEEWQYSWPEEVMPLRLCLFVCLVVFCGCNNTSSNAAPPDPQRTVDSKRILLPVKVSGKWGYADDSGKLIVNPQFDFADPFEDGRARICLGKVGCDEWAIYSDNKDNDSHWGFIDASGKMIVTPQYPFVTRFDEGLSAVCTGDCSNHPKLQHAHGYIDRDGKIVIPLQFGDARNFRQSLAAVCVGECGLDEAGDWTGKWGFINHSGNFVVNPQYDTVGDFTADGFAQVTLGRGKDAKIGYVNKTGKIVWSPSN
jgi:hypothetical protein